MRYYLIVLLCAFAAFAVQAQNNTPDRLSVKMRCVQPMSNPPSILRWGERRLELADMKGTPRQDSLIFNMRWEFTPSFVSERHGRTRYYYARINSIVYLDDSWVRDDMKNDMTLLYCRTTHDMLELAARGATRELASDPRATPLSVFGQYTRLFNMRFAVMSRLTNSGQDSDQMRLYAAMVADELEREHFDPTSLPIREPSVGFDVSIGASLMTTSNSYLPSAMPGMAVGLDVYWKRHLLNIDIQQSARVDCQKTYPASMALIEKGERVNVGRFMFDYGRRLTSHHAPAFYLMGGIGAMSVRKAEKPDDRRMKYPGGSGFAMELACLYRMDLYRYINLNRGGQTPLFTDQFRICLSVKPYVGMAKVDSKPGWMPHAGIALTVGIDCLTD